MENINIYENNDNDDICAICHDNINKEQSYEIPECKHVFHTHCIITWLRTGNHKCPYCNSISDIYKKNDDNYYNISLKIKDNYIHIYNYCKRKNANITIKKKVKKITDLNIKLKDLKKCKSLIDKKGEYYIIKKELSKLSNKIWSLKQRIWNFKKELVETVNIIPFIITKKN